MTFNPNIKHPLLVDQEDQYEMVTALWAGTDAMREEGIKFLPKEPEEEIQNYIRRLDKSVLFPAYKNAIVSAVGKLYAGDLEVNNYGPLLNPILDDIDEDGNDLEVFAQEATVSALHYGCSYILVDYPVMNDNATLADEKAMGAQPYWVLIEAPHILEASPIMKGGKNKLGVFRFKEREAYRDGEFSVAYRNKVKEFRIKEGAVHYRVFIEQDSEWVLYDQGILEGKTEIPVVPVYANKIGFYLGSPYFMDLAHENVLNWQMSSDYQNIVHMSQVPMLALSGVTSNFDDNGVAQEVVISPNTVLTFTNPDTKAEWVEVSGDAAAVGRQAILDSFTRMSELALETLNDQIESKTATEVMLQAGDADAAFRVLEDQIENALAQAINYTYDYLGVPNPGTEVDLILAEENLETPLTNTETNSETE